MKIQVPMSVKQVAEYLRVTPSTVYDLIKRGDLPVGPNIRAGYGFNHQDLKRWMRQQERKRK